MYANPEDLDHASRAVVRQSRNEWALSYEVLDAVFKAKQTTELQLLLDARVYGDPAYDSLPKFRKVALQAYFRGVCDALGRIAGVKTPPAPKSVPPKRVRKSRVSKPKLHPQPAHGIRTPLPEWVITLAPPPPRAETILPPAEPAEAAE